MKKPKPQTTPSGFPLNLHGRVSEACYRCHSKEDLVALWYQFLPEIERGAEKDAALLGAIEFVFRWHLKRVKKSISVSS